MNLVYLSFFDVFLTDELWLYYQKDINQIILNLTILRNLALQICEVSAWILLNVNLPESTSPDILALCESWLSWFWQFVCERVFLFNPKGFCHSCAWCCSLCEARTSFCMGLISRKLYRFLLMFLTDFFFLYWSPFSSLYRVFLAISSNIDEVLSIKISANVFVFGEFNVYHKDWLN